jgi:hypothetical protein
VNQIINVSEARLDVVPDAQTDRSPEIVVHEVYALLLALPAVHCCEAAQVAGVGEPIQTRYIPIGVLEQVLAQMAADKPTHPGN